ncbi:MAG: class II aldolase/adducin family protein [Hyphomicrobiales bacterium]|nr:class II aldolase/adducin family protein [Hyphomicrobiales bacterium]
MRGATNRDIALKQKLRHEIAAVTLLLNSEGILGYSGHVSTRLPDGQGLLIQPFSQSRAELRPEHLLVCDMDGRCVDGNDRPPSEVFIHTEIYEARPDVNAVAHFHHDLTTAFSLAEGATLRPIKNHAVRWESGIPIHPDPGHVDTPALGKALASTLGPHHALVIRAPGQVVVAESLPALLMDCIHFVENAQALYQASLLGRVLPLSAEEMAGFRRSFKRDRHTAKLWSYYTGRGIANGVLPDAWNALLAAE